MPSLPLLGALGFGIIVGWYTYYVNRYRTDDVKLADLGTFIGIVGGGAVLALFPAKSELFGMYGIGLVIGFFGYLVVLAVLVWKSCDFDRQWFLDGRKKISSGYVVPSGKSDGRPMFRDENGALNR